VNVADLAGWAGAASLLVAYGAASTGRTRSTGAAYQLANVLGSIGLAIVAGAHAAWPSFVLDVLWCACGLVVILNPDHTQGEHHV
jgi:hypothetical protein